MGMLLCAGVHADEVKNLYMAQVPVSSQQPGEFKRGARQAMVNVLIRVSGNTEVAVNPDIRAALTKPEEYYYQFSYESVQQPAVAVGETQSVLMLRVNFEPSAVAQLLRRAGYPVWGAVRPNVLVWLLVETNRGRIIMTGALEHKAGEVLVERARLRGLPLLFPLLDLEDKAQISVTALWGTFHDEIEFVSQRYNADTILSGRIYRGLNGEWAAHWAVKVENQWFEFDNRDLRLEALVGDAVDRLADRLAARYAISSSRGSIWVEVEAVQSAQDYAELSDYLENLTPVLDLSVERVAGSDIRFRLGTEGTAEQLVQLIGLDRKLFLVSREQEEGRSVLHYRWLE